MGSSPARAQLDPGPWVTSQADNRRTSQSNALQDVPALTEPTNPVYSPVATDSNGNLYFLTYDGTTMRLRSHAPDGTTRWEIDVTDTTDNTAPQLRASPIISETGHVYFVAPSSNSDSFASLFRVPLDGGIPETVVDDGTPLSGTPTIGNDGVIYVPRFDGSVLFVQESDVSVIAGVETDGTRVTAPVIASDGRIVVGTQNGGVIAMSPGGDVGESMANVEGDFLLPPAMSDTGVLYLITAADPDNDLVGSSPELVAIDINSSEEDGLRWQRTITSGKAKGLTVGPEGDVYLSTTSSDPAGVSTVHRFSSEGEEIWARNIDADVSAPSFRDADPSVYLTSNDSGTYRVEILAGGSGESLPSIPLPAASTPNLPPTIAGNGDVAVPAQDGLVLSGSMRPSVSPQSLSLGTILVDDLASSSVTISQPNGASTLTVTDVNVLGTGAEKYSVGGASTLISEGIPAGDNYSLDLGFSSSTAGTFDATLVISTGLYGQLEVPLTGQAVQSGLSGQPSPLVFGNVQFGTSRTKTVDISSSDSDVTISSATVLNDTENEFSAQGLAGVTINSGSTEPVDVTFSPAVSGMRSATLRVETDGGLTLDVPLEGTGLDASIAASPNPADFGSLETGTSVTQTVTLSNSGSDDLSISGIGISSSGSTDFSVTGGGDQTTLSANGSIAVDVTFQPSVSGTRTSELVVNTTEGLESRVDLTGVGVAPELLISPDPLAFGQIEDDATLTKTFTIENPKSVDVEVTDISVDNSNFQIASPTSFTVAGNAPETVDVTFDPATTGTVTGTLTVNTDAGFDRTLTLEGEAQDFGISASPRPVEFAGTQRSTTDQILVTVSNTGTVDINGISRSIANNGDGEFSIDDTETTLGTSLAAGTSEEIAVEYTPDNIETNSGTLTIQYDDLSGSTSGLVVDLSGAGIDSQSNDTLTFDRSTSFSDTAPGDRSSTETITISNDTGSNQDVTEIALGGVTPNQFEIVEIRDETGTTYPVNGTSFTNGGTALDLSGDSSANELFVDVTYAPSAAGDHSAQLAVYVTNNLNNSTTVRGTAISPTLTASPDPVDLGAVSTGTTTTTTVTLSNSTTVDYTISSISISEPNGTTGFALDTSTPLPTGVPGNSSVAVDIVHSSSIVGTEGAVLEVASPNGGLQVPIGASVENYGLAFTQSQVTYASVPVDSSTSEVVTLENNGSAAVDYTISDITSNDGADFSITSGQTSGTIAAGDTRTVTVTFTPSASGTRTSDLTVEGSVNGSVVASASVPLEGSGLFYASNLTTSVVDFGQVQLGTRSAVRTVSIENTGSAVLSILGLSLPSGSPFSITSGRSTLSLASGEVLEISLDYGPTAAELQTAALDVLTLTGTIRIDLQGRGIKELSPTESELTFPPRLETETPDTLNAVVTNENDVSSEITSLSLSGTDASAFVVAEPSTLPTLSPGASTSIPVVLDATVPGIFSASLDITATTGAVSIALSGEVLPAPAISPANLDFGQVFVDTSDTLSVTVENTGSQQISITENTALAAGTADMVIDTPLPVTVPAGQTETLVVIYNPNDPVGQIQDTLAVETTRDLDSDGALPYTTQQTVPISANAVMPPNLTVDPGTYLDFGAVIPGQTTRTLPIRFINTGGATLTISSAGFESPDGTFTLSKDIVGTIAPSDTLSFTMTADPSTFGETQRVFQVASDGGSPAFDVRLRAVDIDLQVADTRFNEPTNVVATLPTFTTLLDSSLYVRAGGDVQYEAIPLTRQTETEWTAQIPSRFSTLRGLDYFLLIEDETDQITLPEATVAQSKASPVHAQVAFEEITAPIELPAGAHRMISIPAQLNSSDATEIFGDDYGAFDPRVWRLLRYDPEISDYREAQGIRSVETGQGLWLATREGTPFTVGSGVSTDASQPVTMQVLPGWNQIATPFGFPIAWSDVENTGALQAPVIYSGSQYDYTGSVLRPWDGAWVFNPTSQAVTISIPPRAANAKRDQPPALAAKTAARAPARPEDGYTMQLQARVRSNGETLRDDINYLGIRKGAATGADSLDFAEAPPIGDHVRVSVREKNRLLAGSYRPLDAEGQAWDVDVTAFTKETRSGGQEQVTLNLLEHGARPEGFDLFVFDLEREIPLPVTDGSVSVPVSRTSPTRLRVVAGTKSFARSNNDEIALEQIDTALDKTYPNPFTDAATIDFQLEKPMHVRMEVYDLLGRRVAVLVDGQKSAGPHTITWRAQGGGSRLASGVYFLRMRAGDFTATRKMTLIR